MQNRPYLQKIYDNFYSALAFSLLIAAIILSQHYSDIQKKERAVSELTIIPSAVIKMVDLGLHSAASSLIWLYTVQQVIDHKEKLPELIRNINELDPKFSYPYAFAALILPTIGFDDEALSIAKRGINEANPDWRIPYYLATTYHIFLKDRVNASYYFDIAAHTPGATERIKVAAARYGIQKNSREQTKEIWRSIYETSDDEFVKESARAYLTQIEILELLENAALIYKRRYGIEPTRIEDLVAKKILKEIPPSPLGVKFTIVNGRITVY